MQNQSENNSGEELEHPQDESIGLDYNNDAVLIIQPQGRRKRRIVIQGVFFAKDDEKDVRERDEIVAKILLSSGFESQQ